ncbi:MAG: molybdopterin-dependent oxidoreductase [Actinomycetota bacterium]
MKVRWRISGVLAAGLALSFLWAAGRVEASIRFPPLALAERIVRLTPGDVATFFIDRLGHNALRLLTAGAIAAFLALGAFLAETTASRGRPRPYLAGLVLATVSMAVGFADPVPARPLATVLVSLSGGVLYGVPLAWLLEVGSDVSTEEPRPSRRRALAWIGASIAGLVLGGTVLGRFARRLMGPNTDVPIRTPDRPAPPPVRAAFPSIPGLSPEITRASDHYVVDIDLIDPVVEAAGWTLSVHGLVERPLTFTFPELQRRFLLVEEYSVLTCISNPVGGPLVGNSRWTGVRVGEILSQAGLQGDAVDVVFRCADGYSDSIPVMAALDPSVILAIAQNGRPLTQEHGFPCRLRAPAVYGMKNAKWVEEVEAVGSDYRGYWEQRGWSDVAAVRTASRIDAAGRTTAGEPTWIAGVAWAGSRGVSRVEVSVDGGRTWAQAMIHPPFSPLAWSQWAYRWTPRRPGIYRVMCRAVDGEGRVQDRLERPPHPSGASGYHEIVLDVD